MATLYRKHRPQTWQEVVGQNNIKITLEHELSAAKTAHAYLFCGPRGIGKTTVARVLAKSLNCNNRKEGKHEPCNDCNSCNEIMLARSLDIIEIDAASHTGVDNVRENIIAASRIAPSKEKYKVFIIDEVHMLSLSAFNALLKVLEEPPANVVFVLCTTEVHKIPATIISRCERFDFKRIGVSDIVKKLQYITNKEKINLSDSILQSIARHSEGHMRDAESLLGQLIAIGGKDITQEEADLVIPRSDLNEVLNLLEAITKKDASRAIGLVNNIIDEGIDLMQFVSDLIEVLRKLMLIKISPNLVDKLGIEMGEDIDMRLNKLSKDMSLEQIIYLAQRFIEARTSIKISFIIQLPLEIVIAEVCSSSNPQLSPKTPQNIKPIPEIRITSEKSANIKSPVAGQKTTTIGNAAFLSREQIFSRWNEVLAKIKQHNHSLSFILRVCEPREVNGNQLCLAFKYKFHKDRISEMNIKRMVEKVLHDVYGQQLLIEAVIDESLEVKNGNGQTGVKEAKKEKTTVKEEADSKGSKQEDMISNILKTFGGKVED